MNNLYIQSKSSLNEVSSNLQDSLLELADLQRTPYEHLKKIFLTNTNSHLNLFNATLSVITFTNTDFFENNITYFLSADTASIVKKFTYNNNLKQTYLLDVYSFYNSYESLKKNIEAFLLLQEVEEYYSQSFLEFNQHTIQAAVPFCLSKYDDPKIIRNVFFRLLNFAQWIDTNNQSIKNQKLTVDLWLAFDYSKKNFFTSK